MADTRKAIKLTAWLSKQGRHYVANVRGIVGDYKPTPAEALANLTEIVGDYLEMSPLPDFYCKAGYTASLWREWTGWGYAVIPPNTDGRYLSSCTLPTDYDKPRAKRAMFLHLAELLDDCGRGDFDTALSVIENDEDREKFTTEREWRMTFNAAFMAALDQTGDRDLAWRIASHDPALRLERVS